MTNHLTLHFVTPEMLKAAVITAKYDPILVLASVFTAVFASFLLVLKARNLKMKSFFGPYCHLAF